MSHGLPYKWEPMGVRTWFSIDSLDHVLGLPVGTLMPWGHRVYRITECRSLTAGELNEAEQKLLAERPGTSICLVTAMPVESTSKAPELAPNGLEIRWVSGYPNRTPDHYRDEHYPMCSKCSEPMPCREQTLMAQATDSLKEMDRYSDPQRCPGCTGVISARQGRETFDHNLFVPGGPPVSFHTKQSCVGHLAAYRKKLSAVGYFTKTIDDSAKPACAGTVLVHEDGSEECKGGRDDCIDGSAYRHDRRRKCSEQSHGCPSCELEAHDA